MMAMDGQASEERPPPGIRRPNPDDGSGFLTNSPPPGAERVRVVAGRSTDRLQRLVLRTVVAVVTVVDAAAWLWLCSAGLMAVVGRNSPAGLLPVAAHVAVAIGALPAFVLAFLNAALAGYHWAVTDSRASLVVTLVSGALALLACGGLSFLILAG